MSSSVSGRTLAFSFRGLSRRVAKRLGVDASYVSRVALGERSNAQVLEGLQTETQQLLLWLAHLAWAGEPKLLHSPYVLGILARRPG